MTADESLFAGGSAEYLIFNKITGQDGESLTWECRSENDGRSMFESLTPPLAADVIIIYDKGEYSWEAKVCGDGSSSGSGNYKGYYSFRDTYYVWNGGHPGAVFSGSVMAQVYFDQTVTYEDAVTGAYNTFYSGIHLLKSPILCV